MPSTVEHCDRCGTPLIGGDVDLCPACAMGHAFGLGESAANRPQEVDSAELLDGKYLLGEVLGEGGFGTVHRAEQVAPIKRTVAIKVIRAGMDTSEVVARFDAERQALALLDHSGIAKIHDAGETAEGRPYFAMELVDGSPVTEHCNARDLQVSERLELFAEICEAVQHAHQRGIIHRDLKPSNILVSKAGDLKIIDFGIAKATRQLLTEKTLLTGLHQFVGTPAYVSPEQADTSGREVDTRSDIYSLGALLYELLTGVPPFEAAALHDAGIREILRIIREEQPPRPSTRIASKVPAQGAVKPGKLESRQLGELDWVVMRALEKEPDRRYPSALDFARDIRRFLQHEPVEARPPGGLYRLRKFVRRHQAGVAAGAIALAGLGAGLVLASYGLVRAVDEARSARLQAERAEAVVHFIDRMFGSADPLLMRGRDYTVRQLLDDYSSRFEGKLDDQPEVELSLQRTIATAYRGLAEFAVAERHYRRALELCTDPLRRRRHRGLRPQEKRGLDAAATGSLWPGEQRTR